MYAVGVVMASRGYPETSTKGCVIAGRILRYLELLLKFRTLPSTIFLYHCQVLKTLPNCLTTLCSIVALLRHQMEIL